MAADSPMPEVEMFADGACVPNPGVGGWAVILKSGERTKWWSGRVEQATNQTMEITAALEGFRRLTRPCRVTVVSDSQYLVKCASGEWARRANTELWDALMEAVKPHDVVWQWVKGHNGHFWNERADTMANRAVWGQISEGRA